METRDDYQEHFAHDTFLSSCSECYKENRLVQARRLVNADYDLLYPDGRNAHAISRLDWGEHNRNPLE